MVGFEKFIWKRKEGKSDRENTPEGSPSDSNGIGGEFKYGGKVEGGLANHICLEDDINMSPGGGWGINGPVVRGGTTLQLREKDDRRGGAYDGRSA